LCDDGDGGCGSGCFTPPTATDKEYDAQGKPQTVPVITLLVSPEEAEDLTLAATQGQIQLALRGTLDQQSVRTDGSRVGGLVRGATAEPVRRVTTSAAPRSAGQRVITYNGAEKTVAEF
jgi:Flp pilus assembly protein CpaB